MTRMRRVNGRVVAPIAAVAAMMGAWAPAAHAIPNLLTVQGVLANQSGTVINGTYDIKFSLYTAQTGGTLLWDETETGIVVTNGIFDDVIGDVDPVARPLRPEYFRNNAEVWLQIELEAGPGVAVNEAPLPRQQLTTSAFAFAAHHATTATTATSASTANTATTATTAATAQGLVCAGPCVSITELDFDPATQAELNAAVANLVSSSQLTTALSAHPTTTAMNTAITTALQPYATTASLGSAIAAALTPYPTTAIMNTAISAALTNYVTSAQLTTTLADYARRTDLPTSIGQLTGGTVTGNVTATGSVEGNVVRQNGNVVCDTTGNCGRTLDDFACNPGEALVRVGADWECQVAAGGVPPAQCTGAGKALQWDGSTWQCVDIRDAGQSGGKSNGFEVRDDWGDTWDGVPRSPRTWPEANQICIDAGARLPTVTEMWRNRANNGTGNVGTQNDGYHHWTIAPSHRPNYYMAVYLSNNTRAEAISTTRYAFRCIWKSQKPAGFSGNRCFGPPGAECASKDSFYNMDKWSRAPQYLISAKRECELENASLMTSKDYEEEIMRGTTVFSHTDEAVAPWHWTLTSGYHLNGYTYPLIISWSNSIEAFWGPVQGKASLGGSNTFYPFRCVGKKEPNLGKPVGTPSCQNNNCFTTATPTRNKLTADNENRTAATWLTAFRACRTLGAYLPTGAEVQQLIQSGWGNGPNPAYIWTASPGVWGWQILRWAGTGNVGWYPHYSYSPDFYSGTTALPTASHPYRCVWREAENQTWTTCAANQVQMRNEADGTYSCVTAAQGDPNGQQNPSNYPPFIDAWGNAIDFNQRAAVTYSVAKSACEDRGGRLPLATELFRVRYNQNVVTSELGQSGIATQDYIWTLNPSYRADWHIQVRLSDGGAREIQSNGAATAPYRCVWPATQPEAFGGHTCYGLPDAPCFETNRIRTDRYPRAPIPQASAQWECRFLGGRLPMVREVAQLQQAGLPNSASGLWEWTSEWSTSNASGSPTYPFVTSKGTAANQADWQNTNAINEGTWQSYATMSATRFRCVFTDLME